MVKKAIMMLVASIIMSGISTTAFAQENDNTATLVASGEGATKDEATKVALRSAIEQAFGTFVSANTEVINDELVKDEIVSITNGNIQSYKEVSCEEKNGTGYLVTVQAVVSIGNIQKFAQSHGMQAELAGATFAQNMKIKKLNKENEEKVIKTLFNVQLRDIAKRGLFDFELKLNEPKATDYDTLYLVSGTVNLKINDNTISFHNVLHKTLNALALTEEEVAEYESLGMQASRCKLRPAANLTEEEDYNKMAISLRYDKWTFLKSLEDTYIRNYIYNSIYKYYHIDIEKNIKVDPYKSRDGLILRRHEIGYYFKRYPKIYYHLDNMFIPETAIYLRSWIKTEDWKNLEKIIKNAAASFIIKDNMGNYISAEYQYSDENYHKYSKENIHKELDKIYPFCMDYFLRANYNNTAIARFVGNKGRAGDILEDRRYYKDLLDKVPSFNYMSNDLIKGDIATSFDFGVYYTEEEISQLSGLTIEPFVKK